MEWTTAVWKLLQDKVQHAHSVFDIRSNYFVLLPKHATQCLFLFALLVLLFIVLRSREENRARTRTALQAILTLITPTSSLWPARYIELARCAGSLSPPGIFVPLEVILWDIIEGIIEFRDPINDLADLICSEMKVYGFTMSLSIEWKWWIEAFEWWITAKSIPHLAGIIARMKLIVTPSSLDLSLFLSPFASTSPTSGAHICLDFLPSGILPSLDSGSKVTLEFTSFSTCLRTLSTAQIISALPFILSQGLPRRPQSLSSVLGHLAVSYDSKLAVDSFVNVSADYGHELERAYNLIAGEQRTRTMWVEAFGIRAWRRDLFLVALEAALIRRGWIERWAIEVSVR
ncbi:hypothetical protein PAXRUDRAFT_155829 [Paxillus rubicundulus Ve08.2h10]|uniref:Uncharacterized protein n=1 Tax=Paxillus rubicundulus Ve08.2h10 TaxID=930991 RepID=A0A0D0CFR5_9AGAM|nr:hypothetical protein PAXRUDRAFT_155829 [Paxillus rubicundulus Ve08.2h10]